MRKLSKKEETLLGEILKIAGIDTDIKSLNVCELDDGGMGSLSIGYNYKLRSFGKEIAEYQFHDLDGTIVSATLNVDTEGALYELDVFKLDFTETQLLKD